MRVATNPSLVIAVSLTVGILGVWGALNSYQVSANNAEQFPDAYGEERAQVRFAPLDARVPASAELGYFTDLDSSRLAYESAFLAAQYAVAPRVLVVLNGQSPPE